MKRNSSFLLAISMAVSATAQDIFINKDTVVNKLWSIEPSTIVYFGSKGHINGKRTIKCRIIDAVMGQWIFDTAIIPYPEVTYG